MWEELWIVMYLSCITSFCCSCLYLYVSATADCCSSDEEIVLSDTYKLICSYSPLISTVFAGITLVILFILLTEWMLMGVFNKGKNKVDQGSKKIANIRDNVISGF